MSKGGKVGKYEDLRDLTVDGTSGNDVIFPNYVDYQGDTVDGDDGDDDIIYGYGGDDTISAGQGNDLVFGGAGDDEIAGNAGDDTIYGDNGGSSVETVRESFEWDLQSEDDVDGTFVQDTGNVNVTFTRTSDENSHDSKLAADQMNVSGIDSGSETIDPSSGLDSLNSDEDDRGEFQWEFSAPVSDVQFNINDIDGDGIVKVTAYDAAGNEIPVQLVGGDELTLLDTDGVNGAETADSEGGYDTPTSDDYNLQVTIPGPVARIVVEHTQDGSNNSGIRITDMYYDAPTGVVSDDGGDDTISGGEGDDELHGEGGNDSITGGTGNDEVYGGDGNDTIDTGNHVDPLPDQAYPGLYGADTDPNNDHDTVYGGAGNDTISTGDDDDTIYGGSGHDVIDAGIDDDYVEAGDDDDTVIGSEGNDEIYGGDGDDLIYGGLDDTFPDVLNIPDDGSGPFGLDLVTDNNNDTLFGGAGNDTIYGADDDDTLYGGTGDDYLDGGVDDDIIEGGDGDDVIIGGQGNDNMFGEGGDDTFIVSSGADGKGDVISGGNGPDDTADFDILDLTGAGLVEINDAPDANDFGATAGTVTFEDGSVLTFEGIESIITDPDDPICFTPGTTIATPKGERLVEELREGDRIITRDNGVQEIRWVGRKEMSGKALVANPHLKPILLRAGSLGNGLPERDMLVSPNHRMLVANEKTQLYFEEREVLASAKHLVGSDGIHVVDVIGTAYIHFMFDRHEVVLSNGAWAESFQPGDYSLKGIGGEQRNEIFELFPELRSKSGLEDYQSARRTLKKHEAKLLVK